MAERNFIDVMKEAITAITPGLETIGQEVGAELSRLGTQGQMELANALFNGSAFVPYGPGQYTPDVDKGSQEHDVQRTEPEMERDRGGREM